MESSAVSCRRGQLSHPNHLMQQTIDWVPCRLGALPSAERRPVGSSQDILNYGVRQLGRIVYVLTIFYHQRGCHSEPGCRKRLKYG